MNVRDNFDVRLADLLEEIAAARVPAYLAEIQANARRHRQRPALAFQGRWLPMRLATAVAPSWTTMPWRTIGLLAVLMLLLAVAVAFYAGSRPRIPRPFGVAANGVIAMVSPGPGYAAQPEWVEPFGDILTVDPTTGLITTLVGGPTEDGEPVFSSDGTRLAFVRRVNGGEALFAIGTRDGQPVQLTTENFTDIRNVVWSPNGARLVFTTRDGDASRLWLASSDGSGATELQIGMSAVGPQWRPPDGGQILFCTTPS
jgi:hypothetical protein